MKRITLTVLLVLCAAGTVPAQRYVNKESGMAPRIKKFKNSGRFIVAYDKFKDLSKVEVGPFTMTGNMEALFGSIISFYSLFEFDGQQLKSSPKTVALIFLSQSNDWRFLYDQDVYAIADGERMKLGTGARDSRINVPRGPATGFGNVSVSESIGIEIPLDIFKKLATSKKVEIKVGPRPLEFKEEHLQALRDMYALSQPDTPTP